MKKPSGPLDDVLVVDLTRLLPGPVATMMLRTLGARVIKVETTTAPDMLRFLPPHNDGVNVAFAALNQGKESVVLDLNSEEGASVLQRLCSKADILLTSARRPWMEARGLSFESLQERNEKLIYCTLGSYRAGSEREQLGGHDINFLAVSGLARLLGRSAPVLPQVQLADLGGAQYAVICLLAALLERGKTGRGRELHLSLEEGCDPYTHLARQLSRYTPRLTSVGPLAGESPVYRYYRCSDGKFIAVGAIEPKFQDRLKEILPLPTSHWPDDLFFESAEEVHGELEELFGGETRQHWVDFFAPHDVCFSPVLEISEVERDEAPLQAHFAAEETTLISSFGGETRSVLAELGCTDAEIDGWSEAGVVVCQ
jgi:crotonobetainyl-CoA:carnitine CoA-transferase CaiB-like acyl-CoA transferase